MGISFPGWRGIEATERNVLPWTSRLVGTKLLCARFAGHACEFRIYFIVLGVDHMPSDNRFKSQFNGADEQAGDPPNKPILNDEPLTELASELGEERVEQEEYDKAVAYFRSGPMYIRD